MRIQLTVGLIFCLFFVHAQKHDNVWIWGFNYQPPDTLWRGNGQADWFGDTIKTYAKTYNTGFADRSQMYADTEGNLLFFSNGYRIQDSTGNVIENGDSLNYGPLWSSSNLQGSPVKQGMVHLPVPTSDTSSIIVHSNSIDVITQTTAQVLYTRLNHSGLNSAYVSQKNVQITSYAPAFGCLSACKHGNGRDWWIIFVEVGTNCMIKFLLTADTIIEYDRQCIGDTITDNSGWNTIFSLDGKKYANGDAGFGINVFDFDRCSGELSNPVHLAPPFVLDTMGNLADFMNSMQFSPDNSQFYVILGTMVLQYHVDSPNFPNERDTISGWDTFIDTIPGHNIVPFVNYNSQYGPDGILYIGPAGTQRYLCTINNPNGVGTACDFRMRSVTLPKFWHYSMPNNPNYRLGRLIGSSCDTVYTDVKPIYKEQPWLKVYPNPASDVVKLDYNWVEWEKYKEVSCQIVDMRGTAVMEVSVPRYSSYQMVNIKALASGFYTVYLIPASANASSGRQQPIAACKLVKQ